MQDVVIFNLQLMHDVQNNVEYAVHLKMHCALHFNLQKAMHDTVQKKTMSTFYRKSVPSRNFVITQSVLSVAAAPRQIVINIYNISLLQSIMKMIDAFLCVCVQKPQIWLVDGNDNYDELCLFCDE